MRPQALLLDVMETLVTEPFLEVVPAFFGMSLAELYEAKNPDAFYRFERGEIDEHAYASSFFRDGRTVDLAGFKQALQESYAFMDGVEPLLDELKAAGVFMFALSNYSPWYLLIEEKLRLSRFVDWRFVSCRTGVRKPDPEAYLGAARALDLVPSACLFVDDRQKNVDGAKAVGMPAILRTPDIAAFRDELVRFGCLPG